MSVFITKSRKERILVAQVREGLRAQFEQEAERYRKLAGEEAIKALDSIGDAPAQLARKHLLRAETFKAAAALVGGAQ